MLDDMAAGKGAAGRVESPRSVQFTRAVLRAALHDAVRLGVLGANPLDRTKAPKQRPRKVVAYTVERAEALFAAGDATRWGPLVRFLATTGLRRGEALGLKWSDVNANNVLTVRRIVAEAGGTVYVQDDAKTAWAPGRSPSRRWRRRR